MFNKEYRVSKSISDELILGADVYIPEKPKAIVQIIPGMAEHKGRYEKLAGVLASYNYVVLIVDNRGHGESVSKDIPLGYFAPKDGWMVNLQDIHEFTLNIMEEYRNLPLFVLGHSMGALIAHSFLKRYEDQVSGMIFSGMPAYNNSTGAGMALANTLCRLSGDKKSSPRLAKMADYNKTISNPRTEFDWLSYNEENVDRYIEDPLCGFPFTNRGYYDLLDGCQDVFARKDWRVLKNQLPILFVVGQDDPCADVPSGFKKSLNNLSRVGYQNIEANIYENMRHEIFNEKGMKYVLKDVLVWLNKQVKNL